MSAIHRGLVIFFLALCLVATASIAEEPDLPLRHTPPDDKEDAALECFECSRGDLLTYDVATGEIHRQAPTEAVTEALTMMTESGWGIGGPPDAENPTKDFGQLYPVYDPTSSFYRKHVKLIAYYHNEHGEVVAGASSGTLIDPFHVLTAGHCIYKHEDEDGNEVDDFAYRVDVMPSYDQGDTPFGVAHSVRLHAWGDWTQNADWDWDVGLIELDWPIGAITGWRGIGSSSDCSWYTGSGWTHVGYPGHESVWDGEVMCYQTGSFDDCESSGNEVWFDREVFRGQSGGAAVRDDHVWAVCSNMYYLIDEDWDTYFCRIIGSMYTDINGWIADDVPGAPDLMPLQVTAPDTLVPGEYCTFEYLLHNYSNVTANGTWQVYIYLSEDEHISPNDDYLADIVDISGPVNAMATVTKTGGFVLTCNYPPVQRFLGVRVAASDANPGNDWTADWHTAPVQVVEPPAPLVPTPETPPAGSICRDRTSTTLVWSSSGTDAEYDLELGTNPGSDPLYQTETYSYTATGLLPGTQYFWRVRSRPECGSAVSAWSDYSWFSTDHDLNFITTVVSPPDSAHCLAEPVVVDWTLIPGATSYDLRISPNWCYEGDIISGITITQHSLTGLVPNTTYYWAVRAHTVCGETTTWSSAQQFCFTFKTAPLAIDPPTLILPEDGSTCESPATGLLWNNAEDWGHYEVQVGTACGTGTIHTTGYNGWPLTGLESEVTYYWRVRTIHECGLLSAWTPCRSFSLDLDPPLNPTTLISGSHTVGIWSMDQTIDTWWDFGSDACENAMVDYGFLFDNLPDTEPIVVTSVMPEFTYTASDTLADGDDLWFHLRSADRAGNWAIDTMHLGPFWIDTTAPSTMPIDPVCLPVSQWGDFGELEVSWGPATDVTSGVAGYSYVLTTGMEEPDATVETTGLSLTLPMGYGSWWFRVAAVDAAGHVGQSMGFGPFQNDASLPAFQVPTPCQLVLEGEVMEIVWEELSRIIDGSLYLSLDGGLSFAKISDLTGSQVEDGSWSWPVPAEDTDVALFKLEVNGEGPSFSAVSPLFSIRAVSGVDRVPDSEVVTLLNYPNPFNPRTTICFELAQAMEVGLAIYDLEGRLVRTLLDHARADAGRNEVVWSGRDRLGRQVPTGVYFFRLQAGDYVETKRMTLLK